MSILETYIEKNTNEEWFNDHFSLGDGAHGRLFEYTNTNFRKQDSFIAQFEKFLEVENLPREQWPLNPNNGQESHKHVVVPSVQSKLFKKEISGLYTKTAKGVLYENFINTDLPENEKWLINYTFLLNGYFLNRKNYIIHRVKDDLITFLMAVGRRRSGFDYPNRCHLSHRSSVPFRHVYRRGFFRKFWLAESSSPGPGF